MTNIVINGVELSNYPDNIKKHRDDAGRVKQFLRIRDGEEAYARIAREAVHQGKSYMPNTYLDMLRPQFSISNTYSPMLAHYMRAKYPDLAPAINVYKR